MVARLGDFLRLTLSNSGGQETSLRQEPEFLRSYLEIETIRFEGRLSVEVDVSPEAVRAKAPNLLLQPIVENAIRHGVSQGEAGGRISISARRVNGTLRLQVADNGPGLNLERPRQTGSRAPEVQAVWGQMTALCEKRDGHRRIEFYEVKVVGQRK
jgi:two-component system, LytTR family, sensor kinase